MIYMCRNTAMCDYVCVGGNRVYGSDIFEDAQLQRRAWGSINFSGSSVITKVNADISASVLFWLTAY